MLLMFDVYNILYYIINDYLYIYMMWVMFIQVINKDLYIFARLT